MASKAKRDGIVTEERSSIAPDSAKKAEQQAKRDAKKAATATILAFMKENTDLPIIDELKLLVHEPGQRGRKGSGILVALRDALTGAENGMTEMAIFKQFHIGRPEMAHNIRKLLLVDNPEDRVWISFDEKTEKYSVVGTGAEAPDGWTGYIPAEKTDL